ncbi:MAG: GNAT family N-acetyltransferase [Candidatus Hinthialibacter antarcticus]|nr:GNAT family N-acetyltransferase [Candidatus Hinthialibacter antarcticus]
MITFDLPTMFPPGTMISLLQSSYLELPATTEETAYHHAQWRRTERLALEDPDVAACVFITCLDGQPIGFGSFDPRGKIGAVGQNVIHPDHRGGGYGREQLREILKRLRERGCTFARVKTGEHAFFAPAQAMYLSCGFKERRRYWREEIDSFRMVEFVVDLEAAL